MKKYIYGIDVGGTTVKIGLFNLTGELLKKWEIHTKTENKGEAILSDIYNSIKSNDIKLNEVLGYGFAIPCQVVDGIILNGVNIDWEGYELKKIFSKLVNNNNIYIENDANVAALGETWRGAGSAFENSAMITVGTGVGGGIVVGSKVVEGVHGSGGEIGHIRVIHENGLRCNCGNTGCLETVSSAPAIKTAFNSLLHSGKYDSILKDTKNISVKMIFAAAKEGDLLCLEVIDKTAYYLGYACQILSVITNPNVIIIGGGVSNAGSFFIDKIRKNFMGISFETVKDTLIVQATLGNDAGIYGAAALVIND